MSTPNTQSFIIRVWLEETGEDTSKTKWRGHITHVSSNRRRYVENMQDINDFIITYLDSMNADIDNL